MVIQLFMINHTDINAAPKLKQSSDDCVYVMVLGLYQQENPD